MVGKDTQRLQITDVAIAAIRAAKKPIGSREIVEYAQQHGMMGIFAGKTPRNSIQSAIWKSINTLKGPTPFVMYGTRRNQRKYGLKEPILKRQERLVVRRKDDTLVGEWVSTSAR